MLLSGLDCMVHESVMVQIYLWFYHVLIHVIDWYALVWSCMYGSFH